MIKVKNNSNLKINKQTKKYFKLPLLKSVHYVCTSFVSNKLTSAFDRGHMKSNTFLSDFGEK